MQYAIEWAFDEDVAGPIMVHDAKRWIAGTMRDVVRAASKHVVQSDDVVSVTKKTVSQM